MRKFFRSTLILSLLVGFAIGAFACEKSSQIMAVTITEQTVAGSNEYVVRVTYQEDKRIENKSTDIQIMSNVVVENVKIKAELEDAYAINFDEAGKWYSLATFEVNAIGQTGTENYELFGMALTKTYILTSPKDATFSIRVVVGDAIDNEEGTGQVLTMSEPVSKVYKLKVKAKKSKGE